MEIQATDCTTFQQFLEQVSLLSGAKKFFLRVTSDRAPSFNSRADFLRNLFAENKFQCVYVSGIKNRENEVVKALNDESAIPILLNIQGSEKTFCEKLKYSQIDFIALAESQADFHLEFYQCCEYRATLRLVSPAISFPDKTYSFF